MRCLPYTVLLFFLLALPLEAFSEDEPVGWVTEVSGVATVAGPEEEPSEVENGTEIYMSDTIETEPSSSVTIELRDGSAIRVGEDSTLKVVDFLYREERGINRSLFKLLEGSVRGMLNSLFGEDSEMSFETPTSIAGVKGSDLLVWIEDGHTLVALNEGRGFVRHRDARFPEVVWLKRGWMIKVAKELPPGKPFLMPPHVKKRILKFQIKRHRELIKKLKKLKKLKRRKLLKRPPLPGPPPFKRPGPPHKPGPPHR